MVDDCHHDYDHHVVFVVIADCFYVRARVPFDTLIKVADMTPHIVIWLERKWYNGDEAESEPVPALVYLCTDGQ